VEIEDAEDIDYALVDVVGDSDYTNSRWVNFNPGAIFGNRAIQLLREAVHESKANGRAPQWIEEAVELLETIDMDQKLQRLPPPIKIDTPCPHCGREEHSDVEPLGYWWSPCPSDDCPSHTSGTISPENSNAS
jgi:hypothetical protein